MQRGLPKFVAEYPGPHVVLVWGRQMLHNILGAAETRIVFADCFAPDDPYRLVVLHPSVAHGVGAAVMQLFGGQPVLLYDISTLGHKNMPYLEQLKHLKNRKGVWLLNLPFYSPHLFNHQVFKRIGQHDPASMRQLADALFDQDYQTADALDYMSRPAMHTFCCSCFALDPATLVHDDHVMCMACALMEAPCYHYSHGLIKYWNLRDSSLSAVSVDNFELLYSDDDDMPLLN